MGKQGLCLSANSECSPMARGHSVRLQRDVISTFHKDKEYPSPSECDLLEKERGQRMNDIWGRKRFNWSYSGQRSLTARFETYLCGWVVTQCQRQGRARQFLFPLPPHMGSSRTVSPLTSADSASPCALGETVEKSLSMDTYINDDSFVQQALLLGCHDKVVCTVLVVDNVLEINPCKEKHSDCLPTAPCFIPGLLMYVQKMHMR